MLQIIIYIILGIIALAGIVLTVINLPGIWLVFASVLGCAIVNGFQTIQWWVVLVFFVLTVLSTFSDNIASILGAKKMGSTTGGLVGAVIGGIVGLFAGGVWGIFLGPLLGAVAFELIFAKKTFTQSLKAGWGTFLGILFSIVLKLALSIGMIVFTISRIL